MRMRGGSKLIKRGQKEIFQFEMRQQIEKKQITVELKEIKLERFIYGERPL